MHIVIRTDASSDMGSGHVMRCLTLAKLLRDELSASVEFVCRDLAGNLNNFIESSGFKVWRLSEVLIDYVSRQGSIDDCEIAESWKDDAIQTFDAINKSGTKPDLLIVDHYSLDKLWEKYIRNTVSRIMVIDDLANREHSCNLLLDQNYYSNMETRYDDLVSNQCEKFIGPKYLLLRKEFYDVPNSHFKKEEKINRIFMFFGGSDSTHETVKAIESLKLVKSDFINIDVVVGQANNDKEKIQKMCLSISFVKYHYQVNNMAELMSSADLAVVAAGSVIWETCVLGLPALTIMTAQNQVEAISDLGEAGLIRNLGWCSNVSSADIANAINDASNNAKEINEMGMRATKIMGNFNGQKKIIIAIKALCEQKVSIL